MEIARGLAGVVVTETGLSKVSGQTGELWIGGFPLQELAPSASFEEVLYLLWYGKLPNQVELNGLKARIAELRDLPDETLSVIQAAAERGMHPMDALRVGMDTLSLVDPAVGDSSKQANLNRAISLVAHMPTIVTSFWRRREGQDPISPRKDLGHAANYLYMLSGEEPHPEAVRGLETYMNTVVDHGMNNSTFTTRVIISTRSDMISAVVGAIGSLKGPLHGGAPGPALDMVFELRDRAAASGVPLVEEAEAFVRETVTSGERIMGFGHRVYKVRDPRADVLGEAAELLFQRTGDIKLYEDSRTVEDTVIRILEELKPGRNLKTNVEFYTALVLYGVGLETELFSPTFAIARVGGWTAHALEQIEEDRLIRPRVAYKGEIDRVWTPIEERT